MKITIKLDEISSAAKKIVEQMGDNKVFAFYGDMGAGKTTLISAICSELGVVEVVTSPTFSIVNEYQGNGNTVIYHFDCYRLESVQEAISIGLEEYLYSDNICLIEWAENIIDILPRNFVGIQINQVSDYIREVIIG